MHLFIFMQMTQLLLLCSYHRHGFQTITAKAFDSIQSWLGPLSFKCRKSHVFLKQKEGAGSTSFSCIYIERTASYRYRGIMNDENLSFKPHNEHLLKKPRLKLGFFFRNRSCFSHQWKGLLLPLFYPSWITAP